MTTANQQCFLSLRWRTLRASLRLYCKRVGERERVRVDYSKGEYEWTSHLASALSENGRRLNTALRPRMARRPAGRPMLCLSECAGIEFAHFACTPCPCFMHLTTGPPKKRSKMQHVMTLTPPPTRSEWEGRLVWTCQASSAWYLL